MKYTQRNLLDYYTLPYGRVAVLATQWRRGEKWCYVVAHDPQLMPPHLRQYRDDYRPYRPRGMWWPAANVHVGFAAYIDALCEDLSHMERYGMFSTPHFTHTTTQKDK
jgi:hypothetical protein